MWNNIKNIFLMIFYGLTCVVFSFMQSDLEKGVQIDNAAIHLIIVFFIFHSSYKFTKALLQIIEDYREKKQNKYREMWLKLQGWHNGTNIDK